jgi:proline-specific peptidase
MGKQTTAEGHVSFRGFRTWYRVVGEGEAPGRDPVLVLHGGPGTGHDYLEPLSALADSGRRIVFYDQLGCGRSDHPHDPSLWSVDLFVEEVAAVRAALGLSRVHLLGQSWGGMLALEVALAKHPGLVSLVLASALASVPLWMAETSLLRDQLPSDVRETLARHEAAGTTDAAEYQEAVMAFYRRHVCRLDPFPECVERSFASLAADPEVYNTLWGPSEFHATGRLKEWDVTQRLGEIRLPTLVLAGRFDEATPAVVAAIQRGIAGSESVTFDESAHMPHVEEPARFLEVVEAFLARVEKRV